MKSLNQFIMIIVAVLIVAVIAFLLWSKTDVFSNTSSEYPKSIEDITVDDWQINPIRIGKKDAKVTLMEFSSLTCPHCAAFHTKVLPKLIKEYVTTGKLTVLYFDFPLDNVAYGASVFSRCVAKDLRLQIVNMIYSSQSSWLQGSSPMANLLYSGSLIGITEDKFAKCSEDTSITDTILSERELGEKVFDVNGTPSLFINGVKLDNYSYDTVKKAIEDAISTN